MSNHVADVGVVKADPLADKRSHLWSLWLGCCIGAFVCSMVVLATAMTHNGGI